MDQKKTASIELVRTVLAWSNHRKNRKDLWVPGPVAVYYLDFRERPPCDVESYLVSVSHSWIKYGEMVICDMLSSFQKSREDTTSHCRPKLLKTDEGKITRNRHTSDLPAIFQSSVFPVLWIISHLTQQRDTPTFEKLSCQYFCDHWICL